jgi:hypothetical protein
MGTHQVRPPSHSPPHRTRPSSPNSNAGCSYPDLTQPATRSALDLTVRCFRCVNPFGTNAMRARTTLSSIRPLNDFFPLTYCFWSRSISKSRIPLGAWSTTWWGLARGAASSSPGWSRSLTEGQGFGRWMCSPGLELTSSALNLDAPLVHPCSWTPSVDPAPSLTG